MSRCNSVPVRATLPCVREHVGLIRSDFFSETHPNYTLYRHRLASGWFPGTEIVSFVP